MKGKIIKKELIANNTYDFVIEPEEKVHFNAGQFLYITVKDGNEKPLKRAYSICSPPYKSKELTLCIKIIEGGRATTWLKSLKEGDEIEFMAPLGHFTFDKKSQKEALFIATGTGIAPLNSMILEQLHNADKRKMTLLFGLRHIDNVFYKKRFEKLEEENTNFKHIYTLSRPEKDSWRGEKGRVTDWLRNNFENKFDATNTNVYICGLGEMVEEVQKILEEKGVKKENIHFERYS